MLSEFPKYAGINTNLFYTPNLYLGNHVKQPVWSTKMNLKIQSRAMKLSAGLKRNVVKRVQNAFYVRQDCIQRINVKLSDINGPHGGVDKRCQIHLIVPHMPDIIVKETQQNIYSAVYHACVRAKDALDRKLSRMRVRKRNPDLLLQQSELANFS
jgi:ribosome-associated translation inhibitor RaiA